MRVMLVNGSPHKEGCTYTALEEVAKTLKEEGIETEHYWLGTKPIGGCISCFQCQVSGECIFKDAVNEFAQKAKNYDGFIFGSPVYYAGMNGNLKSFMDRLFFSASSQNPHPFRLKPAAAIVSARRGGTSAALDQMNKYFLHQQMPLISSQYWNMVHGNNPEEVRQDKEGLQVMRTLGRNMAWFLKCKEAGEKAGILPPKQEAYIGTNFVR